jgi:hypothetical protein
MQKKILLGFFSVIIIAFSAEAQIKKGAVLLGGQLSFFAQNTKDASGGPAIGKSNGINIMPAFGKAVRENLIIGADISFAHSKYQPYFNYTQKNSVYGLGFFVRSYKELGKGFYLFGQARAGGSYTKQHITDIQQPASNSDTKGYGIQLAVYPGIAYSISKRLQLESGFNNLAYVQYDHRKEVRNGNPSAVTDDFSIGTSLSNFSGLTIGFRVLLN